METDKLKTDISSIFSEIRGSDKYLNICAPMVRYSKLQFRTLVKQYGVDICFTPMTLADSFCQSSKARISEFSTNKTDTPLIVQFAAKTVHDFVGASQLVYPYSDGVDLNCGCPQRWAMKDGYGCSLLNTPEIIHSLMRTFRNNLPSTYSLSVKVRLLKDLKESIELCRGLENCGINFLTVHARKSWQKSSDPIDMNALKEIKQSIKIPLVGNGNVKNVQGADEMYKETKCDGVMVAQGILNNPAMFTGETTTPLSCVQQWVNIFYPQRKSANFHCFHHHLVFMLEKVLNKKQRQIFNYLTTYDSVFDFLQETFDIKPELINSPDNEIECIYNCVDYSELKNNYKLCGTTLDTSEIISEYDSNSRPGKYFENVIDNSNGLDYMDSNMFDE